MQQKIISLASLRKSFRKSSLLVAISLVAFTGTVKAEEITISGNGSTSTNEVANATTQTSTVQQSNNLSATNTVQTSADTGNNSASDNTGGDTSITTGDVQTDVSVTNEGNISTATVNNCCQTSDSQAVISGNGSQSTNTINTTNTNTNTVTVNNTATIRNTITGYANTGNNTANDNTYGTVTITTGNIAVSENIKTGPLNSNNTAINAFSASGYLVKIIGNGSGSENAVYRNNTNTNNVAVNNAADILNETLWILNTGKNKANDNAGGNVTIATGGISFLADILNGPINVSSVDIDNCCEEEEEENPQQPKPEQPENPQPGAPAPSQPTTTTSSNPSSSGGVGGAVLAAHVGKILPITGNYTFLFLLMANSLLFLLGVTLRLRSGRSPGTLVVPSL